MTPETIRALLDGLLDLFSNEEVLLSLLQNTAIPIVVVTVTPSVSTQDDEEELDEDEYDEDDDDFDDDFYEDEEPNSSGSTCEAWEGEGCCPGYDPLSEKNPRCLFLCPHCGGCLRQAFLEELV